VVRLVKGTDYATFTPDDVFLQFAPIAFDASTFEIWACLLNGGKLVIMPAEAPSLEKLSNVIAHLRISTLWLTSGLFHQMVDSHCEELNAVRQLLTGGDVLSPHHIRRMRQQNPQCILIAAYGPTENTTFTSCYRVPAPEQIHSPIPIGRPIANTEVYVLDDRLQPVPIGVPGELYIGGEGLARGYLNCPELTAERFIAHPFRPEGRVYRTGDWVRYLPDGNLEFIGRRDQQVKVRGFRVELGEVEAALHAYPGVREAVVTMREDAPGDKRLIAYVVADADEPPSAGEWRRFLQERLPGYMVPSAFVAIPALPLTPNGKLDRAALPAPSIVRETEAVAPRTQDEQRLADIFAELLRIPKVGIHDNFFELGGDSILAIQIVARARCAGLHFTPRQIFEQPTIAGLLTVVNTAPIPAEKETVPGTAPLTPIQHWFFEQKLANPQHYNQAVLLQVSPDIDDARWVYAFGQLLTHHDALRLRFFHTGEGWIQTLAEPPAEIPYRRTDLSGITPLHRPAAIAARAAKVQASLDLGRGPLLRAELFDFGGDEKPLLLIVIHHLAVDGISWRILLEDLETVSAGADHPPRLPPKTTAFTFWARKLAAYAGSTELREEAAYWLTTLPSHAVPLPLDLAAPPEANTAGSSRMVVVTLEPLETERLLREAAQAHHSTAEEILLTALALTLSQWTESDATLVDLEGHGREAIFDDADLSRTVGWFTTIFPVPLDVSSCTNHGAALRQIKERLHAVPHRGIGYGLLRYMSEGEAGQHLKMLPEAQISFNYLGQFEHAADPDAREDDLRGLACSESGRRRYLIDINGGIFADRLHLSWIYSEAVHQRDTIEVLAMVFMEKLRELINYCPSRGESPLSPMDFPLSNLDHSQLVGLLADNPDLEDIYPLSPMQEGMLFHTLLDPDSEIYVEQLHHCFQNGIDVETFEQSWRRLVVRHPVLRTTFHWKGLDAPLQIVHGNAQLDCQYLEWRESPRKKEQLAESLSPASLPARCCDGNSSITLTGSWSSGDPMPRTQRPITSQGIAVKPIYSVSSGFDRSPAIRSMRSMRY